MIESVNISSVLGDEVSEDSIQWGLKALRFRWFQSTLTERLLALRDFLGGMDAFAEAASMSGSGVKAWLRETPAEPGFLKIMALSRHTGVSLDYLAWGRPISGRDLEVEERRYDIARSAAPRSDNPHRRAVLAEIRRLLDLEWDQFLRGFTDNAPAIRADQVSSPPGYVHIAPLHAVESSLGSTKIWHLDPAPIAFSEQLLASVTDDPDALSYDVAAGDVMAPVIRHGSLILLDRRDRELVSGCIFAFQLPDELVYRGFNRFLGGDGELLCENPKYPPQHLDQDQLRQIEVRGRVVWTGGAL